MPITIPQPVKVFPGGASLPVLKAVTFLEPSEGKRLIPVDIAWPAGSTTYDINVNGLTTQDFSQIVMLDVDNNQCGVDVQFIFPDSGDTLIIPGSSGGLFPVFTNSTKFYVSVAGAVTSDVTRFRLLNYRQEPVALPPPQYTTIAVANNITTAALTAVIGPSISGTLVGYSVNVSMQANAGGYSGWTGTLEDTATGAVIDQAAFIVTTNNASFANALNVPILARRFTGGIRFRTTAQFSAWANVSANVSLRYRTP